MNTSEIVDLVEMDRFWAGYAWLPGAYRNMIFLTVEKNAGIRKAFGELPIALNK